MASEKDKEGMTNMKRDRRMSQPSAMPMDDDDECYEYGLAIRLENTSLDKLKLAMPQPGKVFKITCLATVTNTVVSSSKENEGDRCVTLQITDMAIR